jgi:phosphoribosylformimino-5-aminoimidazole carboxamide ribotide isomerase
VEIIPVIDLMAGDVVHAKAGQRDTYLPIDSVLTKAKDLLGVVADILSFFPFKIIYIADLDAISGQNIEMVLYQHCLELFPETTFWLDAGIRDKTDSQRVISSDRLVPVLGSESLEALSLLQDTEPCVLSLDFKQGQFLGDEKILQQAKYWPERVIVMNLDRVGLERGPDFSLIAEIASRKRNVQIVAAGGVRGQNDLVLLKRAGVEQALIASALHNGMVKKDMLEQY